MSARTFAIIGIRLLAALSFIRTINAICLWVAEKNIAIGYKADIFGASYVATVITLCAVPFLVGVFIWIKAPMLSAYFTRGTDDELATEKPLTKESDFLSMGLVAIGVLIVINVLPTFIFNTLHLAYTHTGTLEEWQSVLIPMIKISLCAYVIMRANKLSGIFFKR